MKKITLKTKDAYDLAAVMATIVREKAEKMDFKEILHVQKTVDYMLSVIKTFSDKFEELSKQRNSYVEVANKKIAAFKEELSKKAEESGEILEDYKERVEGFVATKLEEVKNEIDKEVSPEFEKLYSELGEEVVTFEVDEDKLKSVVINFELFAKEKYTNKSKMVEVYEVLTAANS